MTTYMHDGLEKLVREEFKPLDSVKTVYDLYSKYGLISLVVKHGHSQEHVHPRLSQGIS
jgi:hypothetical protein